MPLYPTQCYLLCCCFWCKQCVLNAKSYNILVPFKIPIKLNIIVTTMHIAHRVTNAYPSSVQSTKFFWVQHSYMMANQQPLMGRHTAVSGMLQGEKHIQFRTHEKGMLYIFFSYNASLSLSFKIFPFTWEHFPVSLKFFKENHFFKVFSKYRAREPYLLRPLENYHYCKQDLKMEIYWKLFLQKQGGTRTN